MTLPRKLFKAARRITVDVNLHTAKPAIACALPNGVTRFRIRDYF